MSFRMLVAVDAGGFALPLIAMRFGLKGSFDGSVLAVMLGLFG